MVDNDPLDSFPLAEYVPEPEPELPLDPEDLDEYARAAALVEIASELWHRGQLRYKLHATQCLIYDAIAASGGNYYLLCSRRLGKTYMLFSMALEVALRKPGARVLYLAPLSKDAENIATDTYAILQADMPEDVRARIKYNSQSKTFTISHPDGPDALIRLRGVNNEAADNLRGGAADLIILDECGQMDALDYIVRSVVTPMTLTTNGRVVFATTPPTSPGHDSAGLYERMAQKGQTSKFTLLDAPHLSYAAKFKALEEAGEAPADIPRILAGEIGPKTTAAQREYFCEFVTDASKAVLPEFTKERQKKMVVHVERPPRFDAYTVIDPGFSDNTGILYGIYDFLSGRIIIEEEDLLLRASTGKIATVIMDKEYTLWGEQKPYLRATDVDNRLAADLWELHQLEFMQYDRQDSQGAFNLVRNAIQMGWLVVDPKCVHLIRQMENATYNKKASDMERAGSKQIGFTENGTLTDGHYDLVAALKIFVRTVNRKRNPYPEGYVGGSPAARRDFYSPRPKNYLANKKLGLLDNTPFGRKAAARGGFRR